MTFRVLAVVFEALFSSFGTPRITMCMSYILKETVLSKEVSLRWKRSIVDSILMILRCGMNEAVFWRTKTLYKSLN